MKNLLFFLIPIVVYLCLFLMPDDMKYPEPMECEIAINEDGIIENYKYDKSKPKVATYFGNFDILNMWLNECKPSELQDYMDRYPFFEFIFYLKDVRDAELDKALGMVKKHNVKIPIYIDTDNKFKEALIGPRVTGVSIILGANNKHYGCTFLGGDKAVSFDGVAAEAIEQIKLDKNGL